MLSQDCTYRPLRAQVHLDRFLANYRVLKSYNSPSTCFYPVLKSNAYGHGLLALAQGLEAHGATHIAVGFPEEGVSLRQAGIRMKILVLYPLTRELFDLYRVYQLTGLVCSLEDLSELSQCMVNDFSSKASGLSSVSSGLSCHLNVDTGMGRLGIPVDQMSQVENLLTTHPYVKAAITGFMTHLYDGDSPTLSADQCLQWAQAFRSLETFLGTSLDLHVFNSAGLARKTEIEKLILNSKSFQQSSPHIDQSFFKKVGSRPGVALYGYSSDPNLQLELQPVLSLFTRLLNVKKVKKGESVSYGATWRASKDSVVGTLALGYADGVLRKLSNRLSFWTAEGFVSQIGTVTMDMTLVDLTSLQPRSRDKWMEMSFYFLGEDLQAEEFAKANPAGSKGNTASELATMCETIPYEVWTGLSPRIPRIYLK